MSERIHSQRSTVNWKLRLVCDCNKKCSHRQVYQAVTKRLSPYSSSIQSNHNICANRNMLLQLEVPPARNGDEARLVEIIGRTIYTVIEDNHFLTEIEFLRFEQGVQSMLAQVLSGFAGDLPATC